MSPAEVTFQVVFAAAGVSLVAATADRRPEVQRFDGMGGSR
ncbi:hypothetical protein [Nucisporomicrobium flavum]|nr:hypothetical protein [Nucisporomicrobium flavum]